MRGMQQQSRINTNTHTHTQGHIGQGTETFYKSSIKMHVYQGGCGIQTVAVRCSQCSGASNELLVFGNAAPFSELTSTCLAEE